VYGISVLIFCVIAAGALADAETIPLEVVGGVPAEQIIGPYDSGDSEKPRVDLFPASVAAKTEQKTGIAQVPVSSGDMWITISPFTATLGGLVTDIVAGYLSGDRTGTTVTIAGKKTHDTDFSDITLINPDENGLFIWIVPQELGDMDLFQVRAGSGSTEVFSDTVGFHTSDEDPMDQPVSPPVQTPVPAASGGSSSPVLTHLTLSASTTAPAVGTEITISGRLTDSSGKGISGATIAIDEDGYPGAAGPAPFVTTRTDPDGWFEHTLTVSSANRVGLIARYTGDEQYQAAESNTIIFTAY
jgi:hypothetical protein